jgi:transposase
MGSITRVGIDTSKDILEVHIEGQSNRHFRVSNDEDGVARLKQELGEGDYLVGIEASGRYEAFVRHELQAAGYNVKLQNPRQVRRLAEGLGKQAKTDGLDAQLLARTAGLCAPNEPRSKEREELTDVSRAIECLKQEKAGHLKRIQVPGYSQIAAEGLKRVVAALEKEIQALEKKFVALVKSGSQKERYELALSVPNVGPILARVAVCELPEDLQSWSIRQLSSYAGVAPIDDSSGKKILPPRVPRHKNAHLKAALYMPAIGALQKQAWANRTYSRLRARGLTHQQAAVAIMHKLLFHLVAVLKRGSAWKAEPPSMT